MTIDQPQESRDIGYEPVQDRRKMLPPAQGIPQRRPPCFPGCVHTGTGPAGTARRIVVVVLVVV
jgi:hypothetical protein